MLAKATVNPSRICPLSFALFKSKVVLLVTTSLLCDMKISKISFRLRTLGTLFTKATLFIPYEFSRGVRANKLFKITSGLVPVFNSTTILTPSLSDSSIISDKPSILLSLAN